MITSTLAQIESLFFSPDPRVALTSRAALLLTGAAVAALLVAVAGPIYGVVALVALIGGLLMLRDLRWGLVALFLVIGLLPFAALPFKVGFTPTFLDLALMALFFVWIMRIATRRQRDLIGSPIGALVLGFLLLAIFAFANGLRYSRPSMTTIRNFAELALAVTLFFLLVNSLRTEADHRPGGAADHGGRCGGRGHRGDLLCHPAVVDGARARRPGALQLSRRLRRAALYRG